MKRLSRTRLFLLELLVNLLVFCVGIAICLMTLSRAYSWSADSRAAAGAQRIAENAAMAFRAADGELCALPALLSGHCESDSFTAWFDQDWQPVREKNGIYRLHVRTQPLENHVVQAKIQVYPPDGEPIAELTICEYTGSALKENAS